MVATVLPNVEVEAAIDGGLAALAPCDDPRVRALGKAYPNLRSFLGRFRCQLIRGGLVEGPINNELLRIGFKFIAEECSNPARASLRDSKSTPQHDLYRLCETRSQLHHNKVSDLEPIGRRASLAEVLDCQPYPECRICQRELLAERDLGRRNWKRCCCQYFVLSDPALGASSSSVPAIATLISIIPSRTLPIVCDWTWLGNISSRPLV